MNEQGATDIDQRVAFYRKRGYTGYSESAAPLSAEEAMREREQFRQAQGQSAMPVAEEQFRESAIPVVEEHLEVGKRVVRRGSVRVFSHVKEHPVEEEVRLREEHVRVERRAVDRPISEAEAAALRDQTIEMTETAEEPVVHKQARVKEEVIIGKETTEHTEKIRDTVRETDVQVERLGGERESSSEYQYGMRMASDATYRGKSWSDVEKNLRSDFERNYPKSRWDDVASAIRSGWESITGRR